MCKKLLVENNSWHPGQCWVINGILLPNNKHEMCQAVILAWHNTAHPQAADATLAQELIHGGSHHWATRCSPINRQRLDQQSGPRWISKPELPTSSRQDNPSQQIFWAAKAPLQQIWDDETTGQESRPIRLPLKTSPLPRNKRAIKRWKNHESKTSEIEEYKPGQLRIQPTQTWTVFQDHSNLLILKMRR